MGTAELPHFSLERALAHGLLPPHYLSDDPTPLISAYVGDDLREEVFAEALSRNLPGFQRFLEVAAVSNGQLINLASVAREVGVAANTVRAWFEVLVDTLIGVWLPAWQERPKRRVIAAPRFFFFFDVGLVNERARRGAPAPGSAEFGAALEHPICMELRAYLSYRRDRRPLAHWRTASGFDSDFTLGNAEVAIEVKSSETVTSDHLRGLRAWRTDYPSSRCILVNRSPRPRRTDDGIEALPVVTFLNLLWTDQFRSA